MQRTVSGCRAVSVGADTEGISFAPQAYAGNGFVGSVYSNRQLYSTNLNGSGVATFGASLGFVARRKRKQ